MENIEQQELEKALMGVGVRPLSTRVIGIRGDQSLRDTVYTRQHVPNFSDQYIEEISQIFYSLLTETGVHRLSIGFHDNEAKTFSVLDPLNMEMHRLEDLVRESYRRANFPSLSYAEKSNYISRLYRYVLGDIELQKRPFWREQIAERNQQLDLPSQEELRKLTDSIPVLRKIDGYFLRSAIINLFNNTLSLSFNCDGTQLMAIAGFEEFLATNFDT